MVPFSHALRMLHMDPQEQRCTFKPSSSYHYLGIASLDAGQQHAGRSKSIAVPAS